MRISYIDYFWLTQKHFKLDVDPNQTSISILQIFFQFKQRVNSPDICSPISSKASSENSLSLCVNSVVSWLQRSGGLRSFETNFDFCSDNLSLKKSHTLINLLHFFHVFYHSIYAEDKMVLCMAYLNALICWWQVF